MAKTRLRRYVATTLMTAALLPSIALAFQVLPRISDVDRKLSSLGGNQFIDGIGQWFVGNALPMIKSPVHEAITLNALDCAVPAGLEKQCLTTEAVRANQVLLYGVRWPDDPPFALNRASPPRIADCDPKVTLRSTAQPKCWKGLFSDADKTAKQRMSSKPGEPAFGPGEYLLYRSHFEPPRILRRHQLLRRWSHEQVTEVLPGSPRARRAHGAGAPSRLPVAVGSH